MVAIETDSDASAEFTGRAAELYTLAIEAEQPTLRDAIGRELLELYNRVWRVGEPGLTAEQLNDRLVLSLLELDLRPGMSVPVAYHYESPALFGGHVVVVELDEKLRFRDIDLRG